MSVRNDLTGQVFGRLTIVAGASVNGGMLWEGACSCGSDKRRHSSATDLRMGKVVSCGCIHRTENRVHDNPAYGVWAAMIQRCTNPNDKNYYRYGGRGITVDRGWLEFSIFWADMGDTYAQGLTLDRLDNDKGYSRENCAWKSLAAQARNKSSNVWAQLNGLRMVLSDACRAIGVGTAHVAYYVKQHGMTQQEALEWLQQKKGL